MSYTFILDAQGEPVPTDDLWPWATISKNDRVVKQEKIGECAVSTIFLGLNHQYAPGGEPIVWETMVFGGALEGEQDRCGGKRVDALSMHEKMAARARELLEPVVKSILEVQNER